MQAEVDKEMCIGCGVCIEICKAGAIKLRNGSAKVSDSCISCGTCVSYCPQNAISLDLTLIHKIPKI